MRPDKRKVDFMPITSGTTPNSGGNPIGNHAYASELCGRLSHKFYKLFHVNYKPQYDQYLEEIEDYIKTQVASNPRDLLQKDRFGNSILNDLIYHAIKASGFFSQPEQPSAQETVGRIFAQLIEIFHQAIESGTIQKEDYATWLSARNRNGFTLLEGAINLGNVDMIRAVVKEFTTYAQGAYRNMLRTPSTDNFSLLHTSIRSHNIEIARLIFNEAKQNLTDDEYAKLLTARTTKNFNLMHMAVAVGDVGIVQFVFDEIRNHVAKKDLQSLFRMRSTDGANLFHIATRPDRENPFMLTYLLDTLFSIFGNGQSHGNPGAMGVFEEMYKKEMEFGRYPVQPAQRSGRDLRWVDKILEMPYREGEAAERTRH